MEGTPEEVWQEVPKVKGEISREESELAIWGLNWPGGQKLPWFFPLGQLLPVLTNKGAADSGKSIVFMYIMMYQHSIVYKYFSLCFITVFHCWLDQSQTQPPFLTLLYILTLSNISPGLSLSAFFPPLHHSHPTYFQLFISCLKVESESHSVMSDSLQPHRL